MATGKNHRQLLREWVESRKIQGFIVFLIFLNSATIGLETNKTLMRHYGEVLETFDEVILMMFVAEILLKLYAYRFRFFRIPWNVFDFLIIGVSLAPTTGGLSVLRTLRIIRTLRLLKQVPRLRVIIEAFLRAFSSIGWIGLLLSIIFYVFAVVGTNLFGQDFPQWFGTIGRSAYTLFQVMTLESWSMGIARPVMETYPWAWAYFIPFILIASYITINIFIAVVVNAISEIQEQDLKKGAQEVEQYVHTENQEMRREIQELRREIDQLSHLLREKQDQEAQNPKKTDPPH